MADKARQWTDKKLSQMEREITNIYKRSAKGIAKAWDEFMQKAEKEISPFQSAYEEAKKTGDKDLITQTGKKLSQRKKEITLQDSQYKEMLDETTYRLAHVNETALAYVNDQMPSIYMNNFNQIKSDADNLGIQFGVVNEATVKRLITDGDLSLLRKRFDIPKDQRWNRKFLNSQVLQGILQGESMRDISKRIFPEIMAKSETKGLSEAQLKSLIKRNENSAIRNARTMVTYAENKGRHDSCLEIEKEGGITVRIWLATPDGRTRDWHVDMDGQAVFEGESFIDGLGNELDEPGDPGAPPETVYNCRCSTQTKIIGFRKSNGRVALVDYDYSKQFSLHQQQMEKEKERRASGK